MMKYQPYMHETDEIEIDNYFLKNKEKCKLKYIFNLKTVRNGKCYD
jgi:hypothetical protein